MDKIRAEKFSRESREKFGEPKSEKEREQYILDAAYKKALETETDQINMDEFEDIYGKETIEAHKKHSEALREKFMNEDKLANEDPIIIEKARKYGLILEAIINEQIELNNWLGTEANTQQTCDYDDYENGIDSIVEFEHNDAKQYLGLAIDTTHAGKKGIKRKLGRIARDLKQGKLGKLRYFRSTDGNMNGAIRNIPRVIVAIDRTNIIKIAELWIQGKQEELANHPIQFMLLTQIYEQLKAQLALARAFSFEQVEKILQTQVSIIKEKIKEQSKKIAEIQIKEYLESDSRHALFEIILEKRYGEYLRNYDKAA